MNGIEIGKQEVRQIVDKLRKTPDWEFFVKALSIWLKNHIDRVKYETGRETRTASLRFTGVLREIRDRIQETCGVIIENPIVIVKVINVFLSSYNLQIHGLKGRHGFFVSYIDDKTNIGEEIDKIMLQLKDKKK